MAYVLPEHVYMSIERMKDDFELETVNGTLYGFKGDMVATNLNGYQSIIPECRSSTLVNMSISPRMRKSKQSPFEREYIKSLIDSKKEMDDMAQFENEQYINETKAIVDCYNK